MANYVVVAALVMSGASFLVYLILGLVGARAKLGEDAQAALMRAQAVRIDDFTDLVKALTGFSDSLSKAGPTLTSIVAAILFLAIAAFASGGTSDKNMAGGKSGDTSKMSRQCIADCRGAGTHIANDCKNP